MMSRPLASPDQPIFETSPGRSAGRGLAFSIAAIFAAALSSWLPSSNAKTRA